MADYCVHIYHREERGHVVAAGSCKDIIQLQLIKHHVNMQQTCACLLRSHSKHVHDPTGVKTAASLRQGEVEVMMMRGKTLGISNLRFLPKTSSLRPIINLGSKVNLGSTHPVGRYGQRELKSVNHQLLDLFHVLKFEKVYYTTTQMHTAIPHA